MNIGGRISKQTPLTFDYIFSASADNGLYSCANVTNVNFENLAIMNISDVLLVAFDAEQDFSRKKGTVSLRIVKFANLSSNLLKLNEFS